LPSCVQCSTNGTPSCASGRIPSSECEVDGDLCYQMIKGEHIQRGCSSYLEEIDKNRCANATDNTCLTCNTTGCNNGPWLKCHICDPSHPNCTAEQLNGVKLCSTFDSNDKCYTKLVGDNVTRGCKSDLDHQTECTDCEFCDGNGCNKLSLEELKNFTVCHQCTSSNKNCADTAVNATRCPSRKDTCFSRVIGETLQRGCLSTLTSDEQSVCNNTVDNSCVTCNSGSGCNNDEWLKCHTCDPNSKTCSAVQPNTAKFCAKFSSNGTCYSKLDGNNVTRGCSTDLDTQTECVGCETCKGSGCNRLPIEVLENFINCVKCDSSNENCADATLMATKCPIRTDTCYSRVIGGTLQRGCLSELTIEEQSVCENTVDFSCRTCNEDSCNNNIWLRCHQCSANSSTTCHQNQTGLAPFCEKYKIGNRCYERLENSTTVRGCESDLGPSVSACKDNRQCRTCSVSGCNKEAASTLESTDRCLQCNSLGVTDVSCLTGSAESQPCSKPSAGKCFSRIDINGALHRGCHGDLMEEEVGNCSSKACSTCEGEGCNSDIFPTDRLSCYQCRSDSDSKCANPLNVPDAPMSYCQKYQPGDLCYTRIQNGIVERGCQSNLAKTACEGLKANECQVCSGENCNTVTEKELKNSASSYSGSVLLIALSTLIAIAVVFD
ncbi:prion-like-(Q/N-rich) domain-bearing protein 25, partial [Topomyia yanbarensis]|uniref:prion-like-(Q/N-rich) domain-bearing protein 25 n=1 Tax=Topomyia yanbarensis TaxID=2498891 RepID=UPI00273C7EC1